MPALCQLDFKTSESASYFARDKNIRKRSVLVGGPSNTAAGNQTVVNRNPEELPLSLLFPSFVVSQLIYVMLCLRDLFVTCLR